MKKEKIKKLKKTNVFWNLFPARFLLGGCQHKYFIALFCVSGGVEPENDFFLVLCVVDIFLQESKEESTVRSNLN
jgi:hypothetical protein